MARHIHKTKKSGELQQAVRKPIVTLASAISALLMGSIAISQNAQAHTDSLGFLITPGSGSGLYNAQIFYGSWHRGNIPAEGALDLFLNNNLLGTQAFSLVPGYVNVSSGTLPVGLVPGVNYFFPDTSTPQTGDLTGVTAGHSIYAFQSATFFDITAGLYNFAYNTGSNLTINWSPSDPAINAGTFTINSNGTLGGIGGVTPSSNDIDTAQGSYQASNLGGTLNPTFTGGTLLLNQTNQTYSQTFSLDDSGTSSIDMAGNDNLFTGTLENSPGEAGSIIFRDSSLGGSITIAGANTYTGGTTVASGLVIIASTGTLGASSGSTTVSGGTLDLGGTTQTQSSVLQSGGAIEGGAFSVSMYQITGGTLSTDATVTASTLFDVRQGTLNGQLEGTGSLAKSGNGTVVLTGTNGYSGGTNISAGTLVGTTSSFGAGDIVDNGALVIDEDSNTAFSNLISGAGSLTKEGSGTVVLGAANVYAGGTVINAGSLLGAATAFGSGAVVDNAALTIDQSTDAVFANALNGSGEFTKTGAGSLNITGTGSLSGSSTVAAGRLAVNGSLANSTVSVQNGARLGGNGTVGGIVAESGATVAPGNSIGTLHVAGDYAATAGSLYEVELDSSGAADHIVATGQATIADGATLQVVKMDGSTPYALGTRYVVLTADNGVTGTYNLTGDTAVSAFFNLVDGYDANSVWLDVAQTTTFASVGATANQIAAGGALNSLGIGNALFDKISYLQSTDAARAAFDSVSGEIHASLLTALIGDGRIVRNAAANRARSSASGSATADGAALSRDPACADPNSAESSECPVVWMQALGSWGSVDGNGNSAELDMNTTGLLTGTDIPVGTWRIGALLGFSHDSFDVDARNSSGSSTAYHLGAYGSHQWGKLGLRVGATYAWNNVSTQRLAEIADFSEGLKADYDVGTLQTFGELAYRLDRNGMAVEPFLQLAFSSLESDSFSEHGGTSALAATGSSLDTTTSTLGLRIATTLSLGGLEALTCLSAGWQHAYDNQVPVVNLAFAGSSPFQVVGAAAAGDAAIIDAGFEFTLTPRGTVSLSYAGQLASTTMDHGIRANVTLAF